MHKDKLWDSVSSSLRADDEINAVSHANWIEPIQPLDLAHGIMLLKVRDQFALRVLNERYKKKILKALQEFDPTVEEVRFSIENSRLDGIESEDVAASEEAEERPVPSPSQSKAKPYTPVTRQLGHALNTHFTFTRFYTGGENKFAFNSAVAVAKKPGQQQFNPLYIYGGVGSGKSHLLHAVGNSVNELHPNLRVLLITADEFYYGYSTALKKNKITEFHESFLSADVLLVDELHRFAGREKSQLELFKIFNEFHQKNKQMVFSAHQPPEQLQGEKGVQDRLVSRLQWGLAVGIKPPKAETRMAILSGLAARDHLDLSGEILQFITEEGPSNVRELEGVVIRLFAQASLTNQDITLESVKAALQRRAVHTPRNNCTAGEILRATAQFFDVGVEMVKGKGRTKEVALCRQVGMYLTKKHTKLGLKAIGHEFGNRDHSTVVHAVKAIEEKINSHDTVSESVLAIEQSLSL